MADYPHDYFGGRTALETADIPHIDRLAEAGELGLVRTIPPGMPPGSDTANLSVVGYDPQLYYTGRSPLEAASLGVELNPTDVSFRCNLVTLSPEQPYSAKSMVDYSAGEISSEEAAELIALLGRELNDAQFTFYPGFRYRHLLVRRDDSDNWDLTPPHDISGRPIKDYLPRGPEAPLLNGLMEKSYQLLADHPVNRKRESRNLKPANSIWIWGNGRRPLLPSFKKVYGLNGAVISAVDLIKGLGILAGLDSINVDGATGDIDTNYEGKVSAALSALKGGHDFVYLHVEAPDECSHRFEAGNKVRAIELIDEKVVQPLWSDLEKNGIEFSLLLAADHATPLSLGTHTDDPVPYAIYRSNKSGKVGKFRYDEKSASESGICFEEGYKLMKHFLQQE